MLIKRCRSLFPLILLVAGLLLTGLLPGRAFAAANRPPNMVFILTDDHRWDALSAMGHPFLQTQHLDRLANEGILFENAFVTTSLCSPSRASFLTGQYAHTHGVVTNHTPWDNRNVTFLERLNAAGYETAFIGKWHMPGDGLPALRGVDRFVSFTREGGQGVYYDCPLVIDGVETARPGRYITEDLTDLALDFITREHRKPFCLYLSHKAVHFGFRPPPHLKGRYRDVDLKLPPESDPWIPYTNGHPFVGAIFPLDFLYRNYCETVASVDEQVGRLLDELDSLGVRERTLVVVIGDHGESLGEHGEETHSYFIYDATTAVPLIFSAPGVLPENRRVATQVRLIDVAPSVTGFVGVDNSLSDALGNVKVDLGFGWEDICGRGGPLVSPAIFDECVAPGYRKIRNKLEEYGVTLYGIDSDGDVTDLPSSAFG